ncbi:MAG: histidine--tRNA ligase, partial [Erysipelotrichaceae bacterium]|nr:histidine--tRNA ligase [Erysipelotrichaceae bacterium]
RAKAKLVLLIGEDEMNEQKATIKNTAAKTQVTVAAEELIDALDSMLTEEEEEHHHH